MRPRTRRDSGWLKMKVVHYLNQFFAGRGGEEAAGLPPEAVPEPLGPGRPLARALPEGLELVGTVFCGDDRGAMDPAAVARVLELVRSCGADLLIAGPAFTSGRYGIACAKIAAAVQQEGILALAAMHPDNPGIEDAGPAPVIAVGASAREMREALARIAAAARVLAAGGTLGREHHVLTGTIRRNRIARRPAAERAVALLRRRLSGEAGAGGEIPLPRFERVRPAPPLEDPAAAKIALLTEGAVVPADNPDRLESARATKWLRYPLKGASELGSGRYVSVHGGFSTQWANADPHRILPLDVARELERDGRIGELHDEYFVTAGNGTSVAAAARFGREWAAALHAAEVQAAILTAT